MANIIAVMAVLLCVSLAVYSIHRSKKQGKHCMGCPNSGCCSGGCQH